MDEDEGETLQTSMVCPDCKGKKTMMVWGSKRKCYKCDGVGRIKAIKFVDSGDVYPLDQ